jgi:hypothetical protein
MPEDDLTSEIPPIIPATEHDEISTAEINPENNLLKKIRAAGGTILEKAGIKRGRGRPKNCDKCGLPETKCGCAGLSGDHTAEFNLENNIPPAVPKINADIPAVALSDIDQKINSLFRKCISGGAKGVTQGCETVTKIMADKAGIDSDFTNKTLAAAKPETEALDNFSEAVALALEKNSVTIKKGGEWYCLALAGGRLVAPYALVWLEFRKEIARKRKSEQGGAK